MDQNQPGIQPGRLPPEQYASNFSDAHAPLTRAQALVEAERCYYCYDAPCITACPTAIDIPSFIQRIAQDNNRGAAQAILLANPLGGMCARVCPTETLCEQACVRNSAESKPVEIGLLQRFATDAYFAQPESPHNPPLFTRAAVTGKKIAVVGAGPAGLAAAHGLARRGHDVTLLDARPKLGGLNEYGLATYKTTDGFAQKEVDWLLSIGGITPKTNQALGRDFTLGHLTSDYDAVFLGMGLAGVNALGLETQPLLGLRPAVEFIAELRQAASPAEVAVGQKVVVVGGGMTAVDAAVQSRKLGAREVTMVYRRGTEDLSASTHEQEWAQKNGVSLRIWAAPKHILSEGGRVTGVRFAVTALQNGSLAETGEQFTLAADMVLTAIGQTFVADLPALALQGGRISTDASGRTSHSKVWAGGDCRFGGRDLTVEAVEQGKQAAVSIHQFLVGQTAEATPVASSSVCN
jgi:dihydropyrimidine dehydrogenase (NAD+) subunit PreT